MSIFDSQRIRRRVGQMVWRFASSIFLVPMLGGVEPWGTRLAIASAECAQGSEQEYQGFGATTPGGSGGTVVHVTNLNDSLPTDPLLEGSFRWAVSQGNRTVSFDVGGVIELAGHVFVKGACITIDGSTAPSPVTLKNFGLYIHGSKGAHDVIVRGIRVRDSADDGMQVKFGASNVVIDHVSISGSRDGNLDITKDSHDVTVSWSIFAEPAGTDLEHSKNILIKYNPSRITLHHNVLVKAAERNPQVRIDDTGTPAIDTTLDMRNNLVWDWNGGYGTKIWYGPWANVVNNFYSSPDSTAKNQKQALIVCKGDCQGDPASLARAYVNGNFSGDNLSKDMNAAGNELSPFPAPAVDTQDACTAAQLALSDAGVRPLDSADQQYLSAISLSSCGTSGGGQVQVPDLVVSFISLPAAVKAETSFSVTETVRNSGTGTSGEFQAGIFLSRDASLTSGDQLLARRLVAGLAPGTSSTATTRLKLSKPGEYIVGVCADIKGVIAELNEANNCLAGGTLTVLP